MSCGATIVEHEDNDMMAVHGRSLNHSTRRNSRLLTIIPIEARRKKSRSRAAATWNFGRIRGNLIRIRRPMDLTTNFLGLSLRSPLVPSASPLSEKMDNVRQMEQAGAAAVVFYSLFEEEIDSGAPECRVGPTAYLEHIAQAKRSVGSPIIASLNCTTLGGWLSYARRITEAGAAALELNIYKIPTRTEVTGTTIKDVYVNTVRSVRAATKIPLAVKLSPYFSSFANMAASLDALNVD